MLLPFASQASADVNITPEAITAAQVSSVQASETYTYVRCWYRPATTHDDSATEWEWALNKDGSYYTIPAIGILPFRLKTCSIPTSLRTILSNVVMKPWVSLTTLQISHTLRLIIASHITILSGPTIM